MKNYRYVLFDVDGTLVKKFTNELLPGVAAWAASPTIGQAALVTNQGGVGWRYWARQLGQKYEHLPTAEATLHRLVDLAKYLQNPALIVDVFVSFAYQTPKGEWCPVPENAQDRWPAIEWNYSSSWLPEWRKPNPGMLTYALRMVGVAPENAVMVGDRPSDKLAAEAAGVDFLWAFEFFHRPGRPETG